MASKTNQGTEQPVNETVKQAVADQVSRVETVLDELGKLDASNIERIGFAIDETAKLARHGLTFGFELAKQWRALTLSATRTVIDSVSKAA